MATKILIAEDNKTDRTLLVRAVEQNDNVAFQSSDGFRAWEVLQDNPDIQLLITDLTMPDMDGDRLIQSVRESSEFKNIPIIIVSASEAETQTRVQSLLDLDPSLTMFVPKPIQISALRDAIGKFK